MSKNNRLMAYTVGGYVVGVLLLSLISGEGLEALGLIAIMLSVGLAATLFAVGLVLLLVRLIQDDGAPARTLDGSPTRVPRWEDRITAVAFFSSAGIILLIGGSLCLGSLAVMG